MASEFIYVKLIKKWGGFKIGDVVRFGRNKGEARIAAGDGEEVKKQKAVNDPIVETATLNIKAKDDAKAKIMAEAKAKIEDTSSANKPSGQKQGRDKAKKKDEKVD